MNPEISLTSVLVAIMLFTVAVAMHEGARADGFAAQDVTSVTE